MVMEIILDRPWIIDRHLGGCLLDGDENSWTPEMWDYIVGKYNIKSVVDIGAGCGFATEYFHNKGLDVLGVDGCEEVQENFKLKDNFRLNDYQDGSALKSFESFDLCWSCEFVEHVEEEYSDNFLNDYTHAKYLAITHATPGQGGYHHVNCQWQEYWIEKLEALGFKFDQAETDRTRELTDPSKHYNKSGLFFINQNR